MREATHRQRTRLECRVLEEVGRTSLRRFQREYALGHLDLRLLATETSV